ncbi:MAG: hypothetical protein HDR92_05070 [Bacteroides sp.]|nr:hypothetical protein [Bacteroides sp.]
MWQIAAATGWSRNYIMWDINYQTLRMMLADAPRYESRRRSRGGKPKQQSKPKSTAGFFQTRLQQDQ